MEEVHVFVSVGGTSNDIQEAFVRAVEDRLRAEGLVPHTVGRNTFSTDAPLKTVTELLQRCSGTVVIALERSYFPAGLEKRGGIKETAIAEVKLATSWNQIEAAMSYARGLPLMVIVEVGLKSEGLLERGYDWFVQWVRPEPAALTTSEFNGILADWKSKLNPRKPKEAKALSTSELTIGQLFAGLKPSEIWKLGIVLVAIISFAFSMGLKWTSFH